MQYVGTEAVSSYVGIAQDHVRRLIKAGKLFAVKDGAVLRISVVDMNRLAQLYQSIDCQNVFKPDILWVQEACNLLIKEIGCSAFIPTQILAIAKGGLVPAAMITAGSYYSPLLLNVRVTSYQGQTKLPVPIMGKFSDTIQNVPTLVVDDLVDSGETLTFVKSKLEALNITNVKYAVLHKKPGSNFIPDWYASEINGWVAYPWEDEG